jgi:hypothetical protein
MLTRDHGRRTPEQAPLILKAYSGESNKKGEACLELYLSCLQYQNAFLFQMKQKPEFILCAVICQGSYIYIYIKENPKCYKILIKCKRDFNFQKSI